MRLAPFYEQVLETARRDRVFSHADMARVRSLVRNGLMLEQALAGTGLVPFDAYLGYLGVASGLPVVRHPAPVTGSMLSPQDQIAHRCLVLEEAASAVHIGFTEAHPHAIHGVRRLLPDHVSLVPYVIPYSAWTRHASILRGGSRERRISALLSDLFREADRASIFQLRLMPRDRFVAAYADGTGKKLSFGNIPASMLPALAVRVRRIGKASGWHVEAVSAGFDSALHLTRAKGSFTHPFERSSVVKRFMHSPRGLLVLIGADAYVARHLLSKLPTAEGKDMMRSGDVVCVPAENESEQERVLHASLAGRPVLAVTSDTRSWWEPVLRAGLPVHVARSSFRPQGRSWSVKRARI